MGRLCDGLLGITAPVLSTGTEGAGEGSDSDGEGKANWEDHPAKDQGNEPPATLYQSVLSSLGDVHCPALFPLPAFACTTFPHLLWAPLAMCGVQRGRVGVTSAPPDNPPPTTPPPPRHRPITPVSAHPHFPDSHDTNSTRAHVSRAGSGQSRDCPHHSPPEHHRHRHPDPGTWWSPVPVLHPTCRYCSAPSPHAGVRRGWDRTHTHRDWCRGPDAAQGRPPGV